MNPERQFSRREFLGLARDAAIVAAALLYGCDEAQTGPVSNTSQKPENANPAICEATLPGRTRVRAQAGTSFVIIRDGKTGNPDQTVEILGLVRGEGVKSEPSKGIEVKSIIYKGQKMVPASTWYKIRLPGGKEGFASATAMPVPQCPEIEAEFY